MARSVSALCIAYVLMPGLARGQTQGSAPPGEAAEPTQETGSDEAPAKPVVVSPETIVVTGSRAEIPEPELPLAVTVVELEPLASAREGSSLGEILDGIPGLLARNRSNFAQDLRLSVRGFGARGAFGIRGLAILLDGIPLTMADGQAQIDVIDPDLISRVEVMRGPAGALYGNGAGGVIYLESGSGAVRPGADVSFQIGEYATRKFLGRAAERTGPVTWSVGVTRLDSDGYRRRADVEQTFFHGNAWWEITRSMDLRVFASYLDAPVAQDSGGLTAEEMREDPSLAAPANNMFETGESVKQPTFGAVFKARLTPDDTVEANAHMDTRDFTGSVPTRIVELDHVGGGGGARYRSTRPVFGVPARLTAAVEGQRMRDERLNFMNVDGAASGPEILDQDEEVQAIGVYGQAHVTPREWLGLLAGARYDNIRFELTDHIVSDEDPDQSGSLTFNTVSSMAGAIVAPRPDLDLDIFTNVAQSIETPTVTELAVLPEGDPGLNTDLQEQRATSLELGLRGGYERVKGEVTGFHIWLRDELVPFEDTTGRTFYRNAGKSHRTGAEVAAAVALRPDLGVRVAYSWLRARFDEYQQGEMDLSGNAVPGIAPHHLDVSASWQSSFGPFASAEAIYLRRMYADDANTVLGRSHVLVEVGAGYRGCTGPLRYQVNAGIANLTDTLYIDNLRLNAANNRYFEPGTPRRFFAGLTLGWAAPAAAREPGHCTRAP
jgi:iron complex outermembrane recepter protein